MLITRSKCRKSIRLEKPRQWRLDLIKMTVQLAHSPLSSENQKTTEERRAEYLETGEGSSLDKIHSFARFIGRQNTAKFITYSDIVRETQGVLGNIAECGVYFGQGLMTYANVIAALEPYNYQCQIVGFDTFSGNVSRSDVDATDQMPFHDGGYEGATVEDPQTAIDIYESDRPLNHLSRVQLIEGGVCGTASKYMAENTGTVWRIIHLSMNLYKPTKAALEAFYPRLSQGGLVVTNSANFDSPGVTQAVEEVIGGMPEWRIFDFYPNVTYFRKQ